MNCIPLPYTTRKLERNIWNHCFQTLNNRQCRTDAWEEGNQWDELQDHAGFLPKSTCQAMEQKEECQGKHSSLTKLRRLSSEFGECEVAGSCGGTNFQRGGSYAEWEPQKPAQEPHSVSVDSNRMCTQTFHVKCRGTGELWAEQLSEFAQSWGSSELLKLEWNVLMDHSGHSTDIYLKSVTKMSWCKSCSDPALINLKKKRFFRIKLSQKYIHTYQKK